MEVSWNHVSLFLINVLPTSVCPTSKANADMLAPNILPSNFDVKKIIWSGHELAVCPRGQDSQWDPGVH